MASSLNFDTIIPATQLSKKNGYVVLPAFSYSGVGWKGASEIVTQFNYSTSKNFVLRNFPTTPTNPTFCLCIRFRVGMQVYRYKIWEGVGERLPVMKYNGEVIKKNFVLEVWNIETSELVELDEAISIITSIKALPADFGNISNFVEASGTEYADQENVAIMPVGVPTTGLQAWFRADSGVVLNVTNVASWTDMVNGYILAQVTGANQPVFTGSGFGANDREYIYFAGGTDEHLLVSPITAFSAVQAFIICRQDFWANTRICFGAGLSLRQAGVANQLRFASGATTVTATDSPSGTDMVVECLHSLNGSSTYDLILRAFDLQMDQKYTDTGGVPVVSIPNATSINIGDPTGGAITADLRVAEIILYNTVLSADDRQSLIQYIVNRYNPDTISFPLSVDENLKQTTN